MSTPFQPKHRIELLAPGGSEDAVKAAILAGADAIYCGLPVFNARQRADNIAVARFPELVMIAHQHGCRIYLTLNTLILDGEMERCAEIIADMELAGVDAIIVQDLGLVYLLRRYFPAMEIHASTQMTTHNPGQTALLAHCGVTQVNVCRELALPEIASLATEASSQNVRSEVFVHGAYCISFSGQCYMSSAMSGKSGNRGECVQPCRRYFSYGNGEELSRGVPLNLKDNSAFAYSKELSRTGVASFKIEGRIKGYKYVYATVAAWRRQLERLDSGMAVEDDDPLLHSVFNRSLSAGYLEGNITTEMFIDSSRDQSLIQVARIRSYSADSGQLKLEQEAEVDANTPVVIYSDGFTFVCTGILVAKTGRMTYRLQITNKLKGKISNGDMVYRHEEFTLPADVREAIGSLHKIKRPIAIRLSGRNGTPLHAEMTDGKSVVTVESTTVLTPAVSRSLSREILEERLGMLGDTEFTLGSITATDLENDLFLPVSALNDLRRRGVALLMGRDTAQKTIVPQGAFLHTEHPPSGLPPACAILIDDIADLEYAFKPDTKVLFELPVVLPRNSDSLKELFSVNRSLIPWFPAILIGHHFSAAVAFLDSIHPQFIVTDNSGIGYAAAKAGIPWIAGPLLNSTNSWALAALQEFGACSGAFISHELSREQMTTIRPPDRFSRWYTVFAPLLLMNTRQCIVRNCTGCKKEVFDEQCLASCKKSLSISDNKNSVFNVVKRPGYYTRVYNSRHYFNPAIVNDVDADHAFFLFDIRSISSKTAIRCSRRDIIARFESFIAGKIPSTRLREVILETTSAQYSRGI